MEIQENLWIVDEPAWLMSLAKMVRMSIVALFLGNQYYILAFEPFSVDVTQSEEVSEHQDPDHLLPVNGALPEFHYLAQYWARSTNPRDLKQHYIVAIQDESTGRYYLQQGDAPKPGLLLGHSYQFARQVEISKGTAALIYEFWVNMLLETHYDRQGRPIVLDTPVFTFSTFVRGIGWMHGFVESGTSGNLPTDWIVHAGEELFAFVTASKRNEVELREKIKADRDKCYDYMKAHARK